MHPSVLASINQAEGAVHVSFVPTLVVVALAFAVPILMSRLGSKLALPVVVGEIFLGIVAGQLDIAIFGDAHSLASDELLNILAEIGFGFLFFLAGTEIDVSSLFTPKRPNQPAVERYASPLNLGIISYILTLAIGAGACYLLYLAGLLTADNWLFMTVTLAPTSLGICVAVLKEKGYARKLLGQYVLVAATAADFGTVIILAVYLSFLSNGGFTTSVLFISFIFIAFLVLYFVLRRVYGSNNVQELLTRLNTATVPIKLRFGMLIFLFFIAISQAIDAEIVLGTFIGGILISMLANTDDHEVLHSLEKTGYGFFVPIFFIMIGIRLDMAALIEEWRAAVLLVPILGIITIANKFIPSLLFRLRFNSRETFSGGMLLTARISLMAAAASSGLAQGVFSNAEEAAVIILAMLLATIGPLIFNRTIPELPGEEAAPPIIVAGASKRGIELGIQLTHHGETVVIIDPDEAHIADAREAGLEAVVGYVDRPDEVTAPYLQEAERFVSAYVETDVNYAICRFLKSEYHIPHLVAEVSKPIDLERFEVLGVSATSPTLDQVALLAMLTRNPASYELLTRTDDEQEIHEVTLRNDEIVGKALRDLHLPPGFVILSIRRRTALIVPTGDTRLEREDFVTVVGPRGNAQLSYQMFSTNTPIDDLV